MKNKQLAAILTGTLFAATTQLAVAAKGFDYTYAELDAIYIDGDDVDGWGAGVDISFGATDLIFLDLGYARLSLDDDSSSPTVGVDADSFSIGIGAHYAIMEKLDILGSISYVDIEYSGGIPVQGDDGYELKGGVRGMVSKDLELNANVTYLDVGSEDDTGFGIGAVYDLKKKFSLTGSYDHFEEQDRFAIGLRLSL